MASKNCGWAVILGFAVGVVASATASWIACGRGRKQRLHAGARPIRPVVQRSGEGQSLYDPMTRTYVPIRDRRAEFRNAPASEEEVRLFIARRRGLRPRALKFDSEWPPPGGLGAGVSFRDPLLHFLDYTAVYFYLVAPPEIGHQPHADLLYMTSSNTAALGCEALLSFFGTEQFKCIFRIWDWAHPDEPDGGKFVKGLTYDELSEYLIPYSFELEFGEELNTVCLYIVNVTRRVNINSFHNEVYLHNRTTGTRDLVWSYPFDWPDKGTTQAFWWGPIFETFPEPGAQYALANPLGFNGTLILQDGMEYQLIDQNSTMTIPSGNGLRDIYRSPGSNSGLVCA
jgi:hypothetical protein